MLSRLRSLSVLLLLGAPAVLGGCRLGATVMRVEGGQPTPGRWISPAAYASFLEGSLAEAAGHPDSAATHYRRVLEEDPDAAEAWARLGAVSCTRDRTASEDAFSRARKLSPELAAPWLASAECALARNDVTRARTDATAALRLSPRDPEVTRVLVLALERAGDAAGAARLRRAQALFAPAVPADEPVPPLDSALVSGDAAAVDRARIQARIPLSEVALRAARTGQAELARRTAERVLAAEPGNTDALVALLVARDLLGVEDGAPAGPLPAVRTAPGPLARALMSELLARRVDESAARAFSGAALGASP